MSGGSIHSGPLKDRSSVDESKHTGTPTEGTEGIITDPPPPPSFNPEDQIGCSFHMDKQEDRQQFRGEIGKLIEDHESMVEENPTGIRLRVSVNEV
jgi:hypothetical protein